MLNGIDNDIKNVEWYNLIKANKNYNEDEYKAVSRACSHTETTLLAYRNILLRQSEEDDYVVTKDNIERLFIEPISKAEYKKILKGMDTNGWTLKELYIDAKTTGNCILNIVRGKNIEY